MDFRNWIEPLESRALLAGVTILTHGFNSDTTGWVSTTATAIADRAGGIKAVAIYTLTVEGDSKDNLAVRFFTRDPHSPLLRNASSGEMVIKLDWSSVSTGNFSTVQVGDAVAPYLMSAHGTSRALAELPIHLIGHSRGASLNTEIAKDLGQRGVWVDQFTSLDPHPVNGGSNNVLGADFGDVAMSTWSNIEFADDYWRSNGDGNSLDFNGLPVAGAYQLNLADSVEAHHVDIAHDSVHTYYYATVDPTGTSDGEIKVIPAWFAHTATRPPRTRTGFYYSAIVGGARPADGISAAHGGTAARVDPGESGSQFPNLGDMKVYGAHVSSGKSVNVHFSHQDRSGRAEVIFFLDRDQNPYNGNTIRVMARRHFSKTKNVTFSSLRGGTKGVPAGAYYVAAETIDSAGQTRYAYAPQKLVVS